MFSLFGKSNVTPAVPNKVWKTSGAALKGLATECMQAMRDGGTALIVTWFQDKHDACRQFFITNGIPFKVVDGSTVTSDIAAEGLLLAQAEDFNKSLAVQSHFKQPTSKLLVALFYGRYPRALREQELIARLPTEVDKFFCSSLDDPMFEIFGASNIKVILERLGLGDDECIQHAMVDKAILRAQEKLAKDVRTDVKANDEVEWFRKNTKR